ncbi:MULTISPECIES: hypothetical protein [Pseudomonadota]|jgi:hypothetical protein|uniref:hypothetical protein n=1 Tax=Pseudomonadota TaxID=1224 RepID=UPI00076A55BC|nr:MULTISPECIES: hypothetical protein [Pseudomonadota]
MTKIDELKCKLEAAIEFDRYVKEVGREPLYPRQIAPAQRAADRRGMLLETYLTSRRLKEIRQLQRQISRLEKEPA